MTEEKLLSHRGRAKPKQILRPAPYKAIGPNQLYSWDITYLLSSVRGRYFYLYLFLDLFSRKIVGFEVHDEESIDFSSKLLQKMGLVAGISKNQLHVHSDNDGPIKREVLFITKEELSKSS